MISHSFYIISSNIKKFYIGVKKCSLFHDGDAEKRYERIQQGGNNIYVVYDKNIGKEILTKDNYLDIMKRLGEINGYKPMMEIHQICERWGELVTGKSIKSASLLEM